MSHPLWLVKILKLTFPMRFILARLTHLPLIGRLIDNWLFAGDDIIYLPKNKVINIQQGIETLGEIVLPWELLDRFIDSADFHWKMHRCFCRDASGCCDYPIDLGCLFLGEAARGINPALGSLVSVAEAKKHALQCRQAGLVHLIGRNKIDSLWLGVRPGDQLLTICNCCPCCCLWRILPRVADRISAHVTRMPGIEVVVTDRCVGCFSCKKNICFVNAIDVHDDRVVINDRCRGCGRCVDVCPQGAIELRAVDGAFVRNAEKRIRPLVKLN